MSGVLGNHNLAWAKGSQFLTIDGTSDTITCPTDTQAVSLFSDVACWVTFGRAPVAAAPSAEKTQSTSFYLPANLLVDVPIPCGTDAVPTLVAGIQAVGAGTLYVNFRGV